jgi:hypothetical protein
LQVEFEVFSAVTLKSAVFWAVALLATVWHYSSPTLLLLPWR